jgi:site-specific DNA recombinase
MRTVKNGMTRTGEHVRACLYARVSTGRQAGDHFSLPVQRDLYTARCIERGYEMGPVYLDTESGRSDSRKGYQQMLADARSGKFDVIVVRDITRFGRDANELLVRRAELEQLGITVDTIVSTDNDSLSPEMRILARAFEAVSAQQESSRISSRVLGGMAKAAGEGLWQGRTPYGYRSEGKRLVIIEEEAEVVRRVYREFVDLNIGPRRIAIRLNEDGIPSRLNRGWSYQTVYGMLEREAYAGVLTWAGVRVEGQVPPIISRDLWERAQSRWRARKRTPGGQTHVSHYLLTGIIYCECGARMVGRMTTTKNGLKVRGYICRGWQDGKGGVSNWHGADDLEARVLSDLSAASTAVIAIDPPTAPVYELASIQRELADLPNRKKRLLDALSRGTLTDDDYRAGIAAVNADEARLTVRRDELEQQVKDAENARREMHERPERIRRLLDPSLSAQEKKAVLLTYIQRIEVRYGDPEPYIVA